MLVAVFAPLLVACRRLVPSNIDPGMLQPYMIALLQQSPTFRQQCRRIAATPVLRVTVHVGTAMDPGARAQTVIDRYEAGGIRADVTLRFAEDYLELLAHEFEHILEQVDGVVLRDEVASGRAWVTPSGAWETRRAFNAGVRARQESDGSAAEAVQVDAAVDRHGRSGRDKR